MTQAHRSEAINLVEEDDGRLRTTRFLKQKPQLSLGLSHPLRQNVSALAHEEGDLPACAAGLCR
jgi:hypothetical protein